MTRRSLFQLEDHQLTPSMETIAFQDGTFYDALFNVVQKILSTGSYNTASVKKTNLEQVIYEHTGILVDIDVEDELVPNAGVSFAWLSKNNVLARTTDDDSIQDWRDKIALSNIVREYKEAVGGVDLTHAKVSGIYSRLKFPFSITVGMLQIRSSETHSSAEILTDTILHEIGHLYTVIVYMAYGIRRAFILSQLARAAAGIDNYEDRVHVLRYCNDLGCSKLDLQDLAKNPPGPEGVNYQVILLTESRRSIETELGLDLYSERAAEQLADQFTVRQGGGGGVATFAEDEFTLGKHKGYRNLLLWDQVQSVFLASVSIIGIPILVMYALLTETPERQRYDDPIDRLMLIRRELYLRLREPKVPKRLKERALRDIEVIDKMLQGARTYPNLMGWIAKIKPSIRKYNGQIALQRTLNELGANRAFAVSGMFASMENETFEPSPQMPASAAQVMQLLNRIRAVFKPEQGGTYGTANEALSRLLQRESEARQQIPADGRKILDSATTSTASKAEIILQTCQHEMTRLKIPESKQGVILSSSDNLVSYFYMTGDYLNQVEFHQLLKLESTLTEMVFGTESAIARIEVIGRIATAITEAAPAIMKALNVVAESGSVACYVDEDSIIQRMTDQLRYVVTSISPLEKPLNPDLDDIADACGGPYPEKAHTLMVNAIARNKHVDRDDLLDLEVYRGLSAIADPAKAYIDTVLKVKQVLLTIAQQSTSVLTFMNENDISSVNATETSLFYNRVAKLLSILLDVSASGDVLLIDIQTMTKAIDTAQDFTIHLKQLIYPQ